MSQRATSSPASAQQAFGERDDFANSKVPASAKRSLRDFTALSSGAVTSIFVFAFGGTAALTYGLSVTLFIAICGFVVSSAAAIVVVRATAGSSMGIDLLSRGAGFGYLGAGVNVLLLVVTWIAYAAFETSFIASAIHQQWPGIPLWLLYLTASAALVPLCWRGAGQVAWLQKVTVPLFLVGAVGLLVLAGLQPPAVDPNLSKPFTVPSAIQALALPLSLTPLIALAMGDYGRFVRASERRRVSLVGAVATVLLWCLEFMAGAFITSRLGTADPGVYTAQILGIVGVAWIILTQLKVQFANFYGASLSMANVASRLMRTRDLRRPFLVVVAVVSFFAALAGLIDNLGYTANLLGVALSSWTSLLILDCILRSRGRGRYGITWVEHRRAYLRDWGLAAMAGLMTGTTTGLTIIFTSAFGDFSGILSILAAWLTGPLVALALGLVTPSPIREVAPTGWRDDSAAGGLGGETTTECYDCGAAGPQHDAVARGSKVLCSLCDAAHPH